VLDIEILNNHVNSGFSFERVSIKNVHLYQNVLESIKYIGEYSGYDTYNISAANELANEDFPENWSKENNHIIGFANNDNDTKIAWIKFYDGMVKEKVIFLGELFIDIKYQRKGFGKMIYKYLEHYWGKEGFIRVVLNVDIKNIAALNFWFYNGFNMIDRIIDNNNDQKTEYVILRLSKSI
jgi:GNAT superfamily N-acetyltransferase